MGVKTINTEWDFSFESFLKKSTYTMISNTLPVFVFHQLFKGEPMYVRQPLTDVLLFHFFEQIASSAFDILTTVQEQDKIKKTKGDVYYNAWKLVVIFNLVLSGVVLNSTKKEAMFLAAFGLLTLQQFCRNYFVGIDYKNEKTPSASANVKKIIEEDKIAREQLELEKRLEEVIGGSQTLNNSSQSQSKPGAIVPATKESKKPMLKLKTPTELLVSKDSEGKKVFGWEKVDLDPTKYDEYEKKEEYFEDKKNGLTGSAVCVTGTTSDGSKHVINRVVAASDTEVRITTTESYQKKSKAPLQIKGLEPKVEEVDD